MRRVNMILKEIPDFDGYYASDEGKIYTTLARGCRDRFDLSKRTEPKEMQYRHIRHGYARVYLQRVSTNQREDVYVHRIIASIFIPNPNNYPEVNHKNNIRDDNRVENLEWVDHKENYLHSVEHGYLTRNELSQFTHK